jgi:subfamily B ATP-binding cassette protein MsbA
MMERRVPGELEALRTLLEIARGHLWFLPLSVVLGLLAFAVEGLGLALLVPLVEALGAGPAAGGGTASPLAGTVGAWLEEVPEARRAAAAVAAILIAMTVKNLVQFANSAVFVLFDARASDSLRRRAFARVLSLPIAAVEEHSAGRLTNTLGHETWRVSQAMGILFAAVTSLCAFLIFVPLLLALSWRLFLVAALCMAVVPVAVHALTARAARLGREAVTASTRLAERMWASIAAIRVIRAFGQEAYERRRFAEASGAVRDVFRQLGLAGAASGPVTEILIAATIALLALAMGAFGLDLATFTAFVAVLYRLQPHARGLVGCRVGLLGLHGAIQEVAALLAEPARAPATAGQRVCPGLARGIRFESVSCIYPGAGAPALCDVSFEIPKGACVALVGPSGAGKSTLLDILLGFRQPTSGAVLVDGVPLAALDMASWRARLAVVGQEPYIFDASIRENVLYGRMGASLEELEAAARTAHAEGFIRRLPQGWESPVGERGVCLSGGQRQRIAIARAVVRDADLLILDEATNALDSRTERAVQESLARHARGCTMLVVAHRLSTIARADRIVVLDRGRIVETGDFATLIRAGGLFAQMHELQSLEQPVRDVA